MNLNNFIKTLEIKFPKFFASNWDNVGLLINPSNIIVKNVMLTNDYTSLVLKEAKIKKCNLILCYHPVIFKGIKCLNIDEKSKNALCLEAFINKIAVYSPHTILDSLSNGINDWLLEAFNKYEFIYKIPINLFKFTELSKYYEYCAIIKDEKVLEKLHKIIEKIDYEEIFVCEIEKEKYIFLKSDKLLNEINFEFKSLKCLKFDKYKQWGDGRYMQLQTSLNLNECVDLVKKHLNMNILMVSKSILHLKNENYIKSIAVCAGSGGSILRGIKADLIITGELDHHSILEFIEQGTSVIITNHSNSERGYLPIYKNQIYQHFKNCGFNDCDIPQFFISENDKDPIEFD